MSSTTTTSATNTKTTNNNNNNQDDPDYPELPELGAANGGSAYFPNNPIQGVKKQVAAKYSILYDNYINKEEFLSKAELNNFLQDYSLCLLITNGNPNPTWDMPMEPHLNGSFCSFLGTNASGTSGCKINNLPIKLKLYTEFMSKVLIYIFKHKITPQLRNEIITDTETTKYLEYAIKNLFYFFGQKQVRPPLNGEGAPIFNNLITTMNGLFNGYRIIRVTCPVSDYGCGRFIARRKCANSENWYILIHKTANEYSMNEASNFNNVISRESTSCGGAKRTRRSKRHAKKRKTRMRR